MSLLSSTFRILKFRLTNKIHFNKCTTSALYITGDKAHDTFAVLIPYLDFEERLKNKDKLRQNLTLRNTDINLDDVIRLWNFYKHLEAKKINLEESKINISQAIKNLSLKGDKYVEKINTLKAHGKMVKEDLKVLKEQLWSVEEKAAIRVLSLPNNLHNKTPDSNLSIIYSFENQSNNNSKSHLDIGRNLNLITYYNPYNYYLKNEAALFEMSLIFYLQNVLLSKNYLSFSNSDFARSVILEGCGLDISHYFTLTEYKAEHKNVHLHLTGGASLPSFMAYFCKHTIFPTFLPLKYFSIGKKYQPTAIENNSLLNVTQETAANIFVATKDENEMDKQYDIILEDFINIYKSLGYHFRVILLSAKDLEHWESLRASFQLYSSHLGKYVEVGNISICGNYISKRLLFNYGKGYDIHYPCIITGTLLSVPKLLSCVLESDDFDKQHLLPNLLNQFINT